MIERKIETGPYHLARRLGMVLVVDIILASTGSSRAVVERSWVSRSASAFDHCLGERDATTAPPLQEHIAAGTAFLEPLWLSPLTDRLQNVHGREV
jgi:hypothetical protein